MEKFEYGRYIEAGEIAKSVVAYAKEIIEPGMLLLDIARKIDKKIFELGGRIAFPVNLSINEIAAHYHPTINDETVAHDLLKVDIGIHVDGYIADTAFSVDLTKEGVHEDLIEATKDALKNALEVVEEKAEGSTLDEIGSVIQETIEDAGFSVITNLSGHSIDRYDVHAGMTIPNYGNGSKKQLGAGAYAIEPFGTTGEGSIYEGDTGNIFCVVKFSKKPRSPKAREILEYLNKEHNGLPFSLREVQEKFGTMSNVAMKEMVQLGILHDFRQLVEKAGGVVAQAEHTVIIGGEGVVVSTRPTLESL